MHRHIRRAGLPRFRRRDRQPPSRPFSTIALMKTRCSTSGSSSPCGQPGGRRSGPGGCGLGRREATLQETTPNLTERRTHPNRFVVCDRAFFDLGPDRCHLAAPSSRAAGPGVATVGAPDDPAPYRPGARPVAAHLHGPLRNASLRRSGPPESRQRDGAGGRRSYNKTGPDSCSSGGTLSLVAALAPVRTARAIRIPLRREHRLSDG